MNKIRVIRLERQLTQKQLACFAGISQSYLNELEKGKKMNPSILLLDKIADSLEVDISDLFGMGEADKQRKIINTIMVVKDV